MALSEGLFELLHLLPVLLVHPEAAIWIRGWLCHGFLLNLNQDARDSFHLVRSLARLLQEALVNKQPLSEILRVHIFVAQQVSVEATDVLVLDLLLQDLRDLVVGLLVACRDFLRDLARLVVVHFSLQLPVIISDLGENLLACQRGVGMQLVEGLARHKEVSINSFGVLQFALADVDDIVGGLCETTTAGFLEDQLFFDVRDAMVIVATPDSLIVVLNIAVIVSALSSAIMDANTMQVVGLVGQRLVLGVEKVLLVLNLLLELLNLLPDLGAVGAEHLLHNG